MKIGYKKSKKKTSKRARQAAASGQEEVAAADGGGGCEAMEARADVEGPEATSGQPESKKARKRRQLMEKKALKAKVSALKKTKMTVRRGVARGVQGATNQTNNQLSQHIMKLAQEQEGLEKASGKEKKKKRQGQRAAAGATDVEMAT